MTTYFVNCRNLDELKKAYKAAAMKNHPDKGGDTATMQAINAGCLADTLRRGGWGQMEIDVITRTIAAVGLER